MECMGHGHGHHPLLCRILEVQFSRSSLYEQVPNGFMLSNIFPIYTYTYTYIHTYIQTYRHTDIQTYRHTDIQTDRQTYRQTYRHTYIHTYIHIYIHTYIYLYIYNYIYTYIHIHTYIYIHTYTYIHIHTYIHILDHNNPPLEIPILATIPFGFFWYTFDISNMVFSHTHLAGDFQKKWHPHTGWLRWFLGWNHRTAVNHRKWEKCNDHFDRVIHEHGQTGMYHQEIGLNQSTTLRNKNTH